MKVGFIGLGKMGSQMVTRLIKAGHEVVATDHNQQNLEQAAAHGATTVAMREELAHALGTPAIVWLMIPAQAVEAEVEALRGLLPHGSIIVDGGNSDFRQTRARAERCAQAGLQLVDVGTSGGVLGLENGFSMMIGGGQQAFATIEPLIQALAQPRGYAHFGPSGAGHYIKMIHNAIEYGAMEAYAEGYHLLKDGADYPNLDLAAIATVWQHGSIIAGTLNGLAGKVLKTNPTLDGIEGYVAESGEADWTLETAATQKLDLPAIQAAVAVREQTQHGRTTFGTKLLAALRNGFGGHAINKE